MSLNSKRMKEKKLKYWHRFADEIDANEGVSSAREIESTDLYGTKSDTDAGDHTNCAIARANIKDRKQCHLTEQSWTEFEWTLWWWFIVTADAKVVPFISLSWYVTVFPFSWWLSSTRRALSGAAVLIATFIPIEYLILFPTCGSHETKSCRCENKQTWLDLDHTRTD